MRNIIVKCNKKTKARPSGAASYRRGAALTLAAVLIMTFAAVLGSCSATGAGVSSSDPVTGENYYLDTICTVSIYELKDAEGNAVPASEAEDAANAAIDKAFERCAALDKLLSRTVEASEVSAINSADGGWVEVSDETLELIRLGMQYSQESGGDFDITVGGVTELWDFHADPEDAKLPDADALAEAVKHVNFRGIAIEGSSVRLTDPDAKLDLGGIAKGYIGDRMTEVLEGEGVTSAIINLGGNVVCIGGKTDTEDFVIGVETPYSDRAEITGRVDARDRTLVTSGVYERYIEVGGKKYHHILDTETGWPAETDLDAVTLVGAKGQSGDLDAMSTICLIKGSAEAKKYIESKDGVEAVFIRTDGTTEQTSGMDFEPVES